MWYERVVTLLLIRFNLYGVLTTTSSASGLTSHLCTYEYYIKVVTLEVNSQILEIGLPQWAKAYVNKRCGARSISAPPALNPDSISRCGGARFIETLCSSMISCTSSPALIMYILWR